jgi:simple sugar transport system substrate-binding protein
MRKLLVLLVLLTVSATFVLANGSSEKSTTASSGGKKYTMVMVVKLEGVAWFDNMRLGIQAFGKDHPDVNISQTGGSTADPALQVQIVNNQIAKGVDAVMAVPNDPNSLVSSFKRARQDNIVVTTQEAANLQVGNYDVEAFHNDAYGRQMMDYMAKWMGDKGMWQPFVGHLTAPSHNQWVDGEQAEAKAKYPNLTQATKRIEDLENQHTAYEKTLELLKTYPNLKAIMGSAMSTVPGAAQAITEKGLIGKVAAFGTCLPSVAGDYITSGAVEKISFWVPADAGYEVAMAAYDALKGITIKDGMDLGRPGYDKVTVQKNKYGVPVVYGAAWVNVDKSNLDQWKKPDGSWKL